MGNAQKAGLTWENEVANAFGRQTGDVIRVYPNGYSGNGALPATDIVITDGVHVHGVELKRHSCDRGEYKYSLDEDDFEQLLAVQNDYTKTHVGVKFTNCELLTAEVPSVASPQQAADTLCERIPPAFDPHITKSGNLRLTKPELDDWPSSRGGMDDHRALASHLGLVSLTTDEQPSTASA